MIHTISTLYKSIYKVRINVKRFIEDEFLTDDKKKSSKTVGKIIHTSSNCFNHTASKMPENMNKGTVQTLDIPESESWMETDRSVFVTQRIQDLVQAFHARAERIKERIVQPPTPSPSPPPELSSENERSPSSEIRSSRPRLQSLIHQEDVTQSEVQHLSETVNLGCCKVQRKFVPTFPKVIDPQSKLYISWLFFVMVSYVYNAWVIVLRAVFHYQTSDNLPIFLVFDYICDMIYVIDLAFFKVRLQYLHDGFWVDDPEKTRQNYFKKTMFKMDVLSLLPFDLLYFIYGVKPIFRISRMLKTQTFWEFFHRVDAVAKTPYVIRIIRTLLYMMFLIHLNACAYYAMSEWEGIGTNGWVFQGEGNAYIRCFYFATKTATSIGKNPKPENEYEYVFMTISWLMGVFIFAFLIGQIRDIVATATQSKTQYRQLMDQTVMYMRNLNLPEDLQRRVRLWLNHTWEQQKTLNESGILDSLPRKMKTDVAINVHYNTLVKVQLFKDCDKALLRDLVLQLKPVLFLPGDFVCRKGEVGKEMYIVNKGLVQVIGGENNIVLATLSEGSVFGEISLLGIPGCSRRTADVRSQGFSNLFVLGKDDLWEALKNYPEAQKVLKRKAKSLIKENEARDRANKNNNVAKIEPEAIIKRSARRPSTPQLIKAVMQIIPKDSKCAQLLSKSPLPRNKTLSTEHQSTTSESGTKIPEDKKISAVDPCVIPKEIKKISTKIFSPQPDKKKYTDIVKPRSMSDVTLQTSKFCPSIPRDLEAHPKAPPPTATLTMINSPQTNIKQEHEEELHQNRKKPEDLINTILNMIPSELYARRKNAVHPARTGTEPQPKLNTNSEDSGISEDNSGNRSSNQKLEDESLTTCDSEDSSELSTTSTRRVTTTMVSPKTKDFSPQWMSAASSVFSLRGLFRTSSNQSCDSVKSGKESPLSKSSMVEDEQSPVRRLGSLTSAGSSAGYDNLAFVPVDVLSRRSSVFSDSSC